MLVKKAQGLSVLLEQCNAAAMLLADANTAFI